MPKLDARTGSRISRVTGARDVSPFLRGIRHWSPRSPNHLPRECGTGFENIRIHREQCFRHHAPAGGSSHINTIRIRMIIGDRILHHLGDSLSVTAAIVRDGCRRIHIPTVGVLRDDHDEAVLICRRHNATGLRLGKNTSSSPAPIVQEFQGIEWLQKRGHLAETKMSGLLTRAWPAGWSWRPRVAPDGASLLCALPCGRFGLAGAAAICRLAGMSMDTELQKHYALLLGIGSPWEVTAVELDRKSTRRNSSHRVISYAV